jgi:hypothetical protein
MCGISATFMSQIGTMLRRTILAFLYTIGSLIAQLLIKNCTIIVQDFRAAPSLEPGWVPTRMGAAGAPDDIDKAHRTQVWLATSDEPAATVSGRYFFHQKKRDPDPA